MNVECRDNHGQVARGTEGGRGTGIQKARRKQQTPGTRNTAGPGLSREGWADKKSQGAGIRHRGEETDQKGALQFWGMCGRCRGRF